MPGDTESKPLNLLLIYVAILHIVELLDQMLNLFRVVTVVDKYHRRVDILDVDLMQEVVSPGTPLQLGRHGNITDNLLEVIVKGGVQSNDAIWEERDQLILGEELVLGQQQLSLLF